MTWIPVIIIGLALGLAQMRWPWLAGSYAIVSLAAAAGAVYRHRWFTVVFQVVVTLVWTNYYRKYKREVSHANQLREDR